MADLAGRLRDRIARDGALNFYDWVDACLYDADDGYYMRPGRKTGPGPDADFATAPTLHPFLGTAIGKEAQRLWQGLGRPAAFCVVEFGAGEGDLAAAALAWLDEHAPALADDITWHAVERSPEQRRRVAVEDARFTAAEGMPDHVAGLVVANEFVDALPFHLLEWHKGNWAEVLVTWDDDAGRFVEALGIPRRRAVEAAPKRLVGDGQRVTSMVAARSWIAATAARLDAGAVVVVDYGERGRDLWTPDRPAGTVRGYRGHALVDDVLAAPGEVDITASVDFTQLREWGLVGGLREDLFVTQERFLVDAGALEALAAAPRATLEEASAYLRLKQLVVPQGMGTAFKVQRLVKGLADDDA